MHQILLEKVVSSVPMKSVTNKKWWENTIRTRALYGEKEKKIFKKNYETTLKITLKNIYKFFYMDKILNYKIIHLNERKKKHWMYYINKQYY